MNFKGLYIDLFSTGSNPDDPRIPLLQEWAGQCVKRARDRDADPYYLKLAEWDLAHAPQHASRAAERAATSIAIAVGGNDPLNSGPFFAAFDAEVAKQQKRFEEIFPDQAGIDPVEEPSTWEGGEADYTGYIGPGGLMSR